MRDAKGNVDYARITALVLLCLVGVRVFANLASPLNLYADEAQYWRWGETLEWGYYSKPPMIAWVIHASTAVFGHSEWAVRFPAALLHGVSAWFLFLLGRNMYGANVGFLAALGYALMPAVTLSSAVISTDGVLLPFWCLALWSLWRLRSGQGTWVSAIGLGVGVGIGFLSKYAMIYFALGLGLAVLMDRETRRVLLGPKGLVAAAVAGALFAPHIAWNMAHDFKTVSHTVDNANLGADLINPENALTFLVDQLGVFGPISFLALLAGLFVMRSEDDGIMGRDRWLLCFVVPALVIILFQAVLSRANANWAATAYPAASVLVASWLVRAGANRGLWFAIAGVTCLGLQFVPDMGWLTKALVGAVTAGAILGVGALSRYRPAGLLWTSIGLHGVLAASATTIALLPPTATTALGFDNGLKRTRGWDTLTAEVFARAEDLGASAVLVDEREVWHGLDYYARDRAIDMYSWRRYGVPKSFAETAPLTAPQDQRVLVASYHDGFRARMRSDFETFEHVGTASVDLGQRGNGCPLTRTLELYLASGHVPAERTARWEAKFDGVRERSKPKCPAPQADGADDAP